MAKKPAAKKTAKKVAKKPAARKSTAAKAKESAVEAKPAKPKAAAKSGPKPVAKKVAKKPASKKSATKKTEATAPKADKAKAGDKKPAATKKTPAKKPAADASTPKKSGAKKAAAEPADTSKGKKSSGKAAATKESTASAAKAPEAGDTGADAGDDKKSGRKGITIVQPTKKPAAKSKPVSKHVPPVRPMLLGPGSKLTKPLIPSGPSAPKPASALESPKSRRTKSPLTKAKLEKYRQLLLAKRAELLGDVVSMESEALLSGSGGLSNTPQHIAEQGSENYDQTLSLNLAAQERRLIKEIDDALRRVEDGTYGLCELTNLPIPEERLDELPWARHTIEAARQLEKNWGIPS